MSEKHTTQDLVFWLGCRKTNNSAHNFVIDAIVARLRAADALCSAAKDAKHELTFAPCRDNPERTSCLKCGTTEALRKAIADYEPEGGKG
jgi:hypothetical protein